MNGGDRVAEVLQSYGVRFLFTLCGGHISPILAGAEARGIRVVDVRHEVNAVFAADAVARLTGVPGVAAVTAGPGLTNTITAVKNAQMAQSPLVILGGATATLLKGRGSLQDIDQLALMRPHVKAMLACKTVRSLAPAVDEAMRLSLEGIPGPVFVECPVDLLYGQDLIRQWYADATPRGKSISARAQRTYIQYHLDRVFKGADEPAPAPRPRRSRTPRPTPSRRPSPR
ncbi:MAG: thiamine pyrophosphate-binding protein [bacterium]